MLALPESFWFDAPVLGAKPFSVSRYDAFICAAAGLWSGLIIGYLTEFYTSHSHGPVRRLAKAGGGGPAPLVIDGLALGFSSTIVSVTILAALVYVSF